MLNILKNLPFILTMVVAVTLAFLYDLYLSFSDRDKASIQRKQLEK